MSFVLTKGTDNEDATELAYVACAHACVASENQGYQTISAVRFDVHCLIFFRRKKDQETSKRSSKILFGHGKQKYFLQKPVIEKLKG